MARLNDVFPPGRYPVVVIGTGPGGLQMSHSLRALGVDHALLSADEHPGGMFRRFPFFQRLVTWTKQHAPVDRSSPRYGWYDWNSLISENGKTAYVADHMDGTSYFPARSEMEAGLVAFAGATDISARYGCRWESTARDDEGFVIGTSDGEYRARAVVFAIGMTQPWKPDIPGLENVPHYVETRTPREYAGKRIFIMGKRNSGFELADGLLPWARQLILGSPRPARLSVIARSTAAARARYLQPYEDHVLGGGNVVLDAAIDKVEKTSDGTFRVFTTGTTRPGQWDFEVDEVIAGTGFTTPMLDLPALGVKVFSQGRLPAQTPYWESATVPDLFFAGSVTQGSIGLKKYGNPSNSAAVHGFRYNAFVLARHIAERYAGYRAPTRPVAPDEVVNLLLEAATNDAALWNQQSYLARIVTVAEQPVDAGLRPLAAFVDEQGSDAVAIAVETDASGDIHPAVYVRRGGQVEEHLLPSEPLHRFDTPEHHSLLSSILKGVIG